jgi:hypothetical protein
MEIFIIQDLLPRFYDFISSWLALIISVLNTKIIGLWILLLKRLKLLIKKD